MSQLPRRPIMIDPATGLPYPMDPGVDPTMGMGTPPPAAQPGVMSKIQNVLGGPQGMMNLGASLLAGSGPSPVKQNLGSILGQSLLANQQFKQQQDDSELKKMLLMSQIERNKRGTTGKTPSKVQEYEYAKAQGFKGSFDEWMRVASAQQSTPASIQEYEYFNKLDPEGQKRFLSLQRSPVVPQIALVNGVPTLVDRTGNTPPNPLSTQESEIDAARRKAAAEAEAKARATATGEAVATAQMDLPRLEQNTSQALQTIDQLKKHPGLPYITGLYSTAPIIPNTPQAGADALAKQIQGKTFLEAFTTLKGGGQITEIEGAKAEAAIARLQRSQNRREYIQALGELEDVMKVGLERSRRRAGGTATPRSREDILKQYGVQ